MNYLLSLSETKISTEQFNTKEGVILAYFKADWCGNCDYLKHTLRILKEEMNKEFQLIEIDVDEQPIVAAAFKIRTVPTLILFKDGEIQWSHSGQINKDKIKNILRNE